jgi:Tfp pilus assembly protein PilP
MMAAPLIGNMPLSNGYNSLVNPMQQPMYVPVYQPSANGTNNGNAPSPLALPPVTSNNSIEVNNNSAPATKPSSSFTTTTASAAPASSFTLIGVLDLGDRSTAMFDINGSVQSIGLGKTLGNTGWALYRVSQQEIILKRGKETKTIFVGQKF